MFGYFKKLKETQLKLNKLKRGIEILSETVPEAKILLGEFPIKTLDLNATYCKFDSNLRINRIVVKTPDNKYKILSLTDSGNLETPILELFSSEKCILEHMNYHGYIKIKD